MVKSKINRVLIKATGPQPKATDLEGYTRYDIPWNDGTGENLYIWMKPDGQSQDVFIGSDENLKVVTRSRDIIFKTNTAGVVSSSQAQATLRVIQTNAIYTYRLILSVDHETLTAAGGTAKVSAQLEAKIGDEIIYTKEVNPTITLQESTPGFSLNGSTLTVENRTTAIGNARTCTMLATVNTEETGEEVFSTIAVTQEGNYVESISLTKGNFSYVNTVAAGQVVKPTSNGSTPVFTFTSGSTTTVVPSSTYGTVIRSTTYSSQASEGFSAANIETGAVTVTSRGSIIGNTRTSNTITRHESYSFVPASGYDAKGQIDCELDSQATVTQAKNVPVSVSVTLDFTYPSGDIPASGGTKIPSIDADITITWSSGGTSTADETGESGYTVTKAPNWIMTAADGFTIDSSTGTVTAENRGTIEGDSYTSGDITLTSEVTINISEEYGGGSVSDEQEITKDDPVTQAPNHRIQVFSKPTITEFTVADIPAKGGIVNSGEVSYHQASTWYYDSGETAEGPSYTEGGSVQFGSAITAASLGTTVKSRSVVGTLTCTVSMNGQTSVEGDAVVYQQANAITSYGNVNLTVQTPINCDVLGGSYKITPTASQTITYTSEATRAGTIKLTYAQKSAMSGFSLSGQSVTVTENKSASVRNGYTVTVTATGEGSKSASKEVVFNQTAGTKSYANPVISVFTYPTIAAKGGTVTPTIEYSQTWGWNDSTTDGGTITTGAALSFTGNKVTSEGSVSASTKGTSVSGVTTVDTVTLKVTLNNKSVTKAFTVQQAANAITTYGNVTISGGTVADIPAAGGTISSMSGISASQTITYTSGATRAGDVDITYSTAVKASSLGTTVKARTKIGTLTATAKGEGSKSATKSLDVYQSANTATYGNVTITGGTVADIPASGGSVSSMSGISASQTVSFTSGSTRAGEVSISYSTAVSASSLSTTVKSRTKIGTLTATATGEGSKSASKAVDVYQAANSQTETGRTISLSVASGDIPASGGTKAVTRSGSISYKYTSGATSSTSFIPTLSISGTGFTLSGTTVTAASRGTTVGEARSATVTASYTGATSKTVTITQAANATTSITYGTPTVNLTVSDIPASGGTVSSGTVTYSQSRIQNYTSGATSSLSALTSGGTVKYSTAVSASSLSTTVKSRTKIGTLTATVTMNGKSGSASKDVYQAANSATYGNVTITGGSVSVIPASGGSVSSASGISASQTVSFTSGATRAGNVNITYSSAVSASSKGTTISNQTTAGTLTATASGEGSKKATKQFTVYQAKNVPTKIAVTNHTYSYPTGAIAASGGTKSPSGGSEVKVTWSSGSTSVVGGDGATGITMSWTGPEYSMTSASGFSINASTGVITASNRGTTEGAARSCGNCSRYVTWTLTISDTYGGGSLTTSDTKTLTAPVSQAANTATYTISISAPTGDIDAGGGTKVITRSGAISYTSGSTGSFIPNLAISQSTGFSLNGTTVTAASRGATVGDRRSCTVTASYSGATSKSVTIYQEANAATTITYGNPTVSLSNAADIPASGGSVSSCTVSYTQTRTQNYTSGATSPLSNVTSGGYVAWGTAVSAPSLGMTVKNRTQVGTLTATVTLNGKSGKGSIAVYQQANTRTIEDITYGDWVISIRASDYSLSLRPAPASGGTCTITASASRTRTQNYSYTSGATSTEALSSETGTPTIEVQGAGLSQSSSDPTKVTWASRGNIVGDRREGVVNATYSGVTKGIILYQEANAQEQTIYGTPEVTIESVADIPASGGSVNTGTCSYSQSRTYVYTSGATFEGSPLTRGGTVTWTIVSAGSKGTTVSGRTLVGTITCRVTMNGKSGNKSATVYQAANAIISTEIGWKSGTNNTNPQRGRGVYSGDTVQIEFTTSSGSFVMFPIEYLYYHYTSGDEYTEDFSSKVLNSSTLTSNNTSFISSGSIFGILSENSSTSSRSGIVTCTYKYEENTYTLKFNVTQPGVTNHLEVSPTSLSFTASGETKSISIDTNESWTIS